MSFPEMSDAERKLWRALRAGRLGNIRFRRGVSLGPCTVDFLCPEQNLVLAIGAAQTGATQTGDGEAAAWLAANGYRVLRFSHDEILLEFDSVMQRIRHAIGLDLDWQASPVTIILPSGSAFAGEA